MKYRLPSGCTVVSHAGKELTVASDGTVELDADAAADLLPHGVELVAAGNKPASPPTQTPASGGKPGDNTSPDKRMLR